MPASADQMSGWELTGVSIPPNGIVRARGFVSGDHRTAGWFVEDYDSQPRLYITNAVVRPDGLAQFEVVAPSNGFYTVLSSTNLASWKSGPILGDATNRFRVTFPQPIPQLGNLFLRVVSGQVPSGPAQKVGP